MTDSFQPTAMVVLASEQLWPNIHGLMHWHSPALRDLFIYHTDDERRSIKPAQSLRSFCREQFPNLRVHLPDRPCGIFPNDVLTMVQHWRERSPGATWLINASGGLKPMFAGLLPLVGQEKVQIVYREIQQGWFALVPGGECGAVRCEPRIVPDEVTDRIPVQRLLQATLGVEQDSLTFGGAGEDLDLRALVRAGLECEMNWQQMFFRAGYPCNEQHGKLFERFVAAIFRRLGVANLACNVVWTGAEGGVHLEEIDLVANHRGRLIIVDCKLRSEAEEQARRADHVSHQIRQAAQTRRALGGLGAELVLLRPNRRFTLDMRKLAEAAQVKVLDAQDFGQLFTRLAKLVRIDTVPPEFHELETLLQQRRTEGRVYPFGCEKKEVRRVSQAAKEPGVVDLETCLSLYRQELDQEWVVLRLGTWFLLNCGNPKGLAKDRFLDRVRRVLGRFGVVDQVIPTAGGRYRIYLVHQAAQEAQFRQWLATRRDRTLLGDD